MSGGSRTAVTRTEPWEEQQEYLEAGFGAAKDLYNKGAPTYYSGPTVAGFDPAQQAAQAATLGYAMGPRPAAQQDAAESNLLGLQSGAVDTSVLSPMVGVMARDVMNEVNPMLADIRSKQVLYQPGGGSRGDIAVGNVMTSATQRLADNAARMYQNAYESAQGRRMGALSAYPSIMSAPMGMYGAMADVGAQRRAMTQEGINRDIAKAMYEKQAPQTALANYMASISGDYGGTTLASTPGPGMMGNLGSLASIASIFM